MYMCVCVCVCVYICIYIYTNYAHGCHLLAAGSTWDYNTFLRVSGRSFVYFRTVVRQSVRHRQHDLQVVAGERDARAHTKGLRTRAQSHWCSSQRWRDSFP
jgi:hypothetical protein